MDRRAFLRTLGLGLSVTAVGIRPVRLNPEWLHAPYQVHYYLALDPENPEGPYKVFPGFHGRGGMTLGLQRVVFGRDGKPKLDSYPVRIDRRGRFIQPLVGISAPDPLKTDKNLRYAAQCRVKCFE